MQMIFHDALSLTSCTDSEHREQRFVHVLFQIDYSRLSIWLIGSSTRVSANHSVCDRYREKQVHYESGITFSCELVFDFDFSSQ